MLFHVPHIGAEQEASMVAMYSHPVGRYRSPLKSCLLELLINAVVLNCQCNWGVLGEYLCKLPSASERSHAQLLKQTHPREVRHWTNVEGDRTGKIIK